MSVSENIRGLAREGLATAEIARRLGIRYQQAYNVLKAGGTLAPASGKTGERSPPAPVPLKPSLSVAELISGGFVVSSRWILSNAGGLELDRALPKTVGVYAFAKDGIVLYVGVATIGLAKRLYFYGKPGVPQRTSRRLNGIIRNELLTTPCIDIYTAVPPDLEWNGLPIHGSAGLELGLIKKYALPWNMRSAGQ
ncbi:MAG: GIY-YIG nuclease family protein [Acetobacteraceae bacterium]